MRLKKCMFALIVLILSGNHLYGSPVDPTCIPVTITPTFTDTPTLGPTPGPGTPTWTPTNTPTNTPTITWIPTYAWPPAPGTPTWTKTPCYVLVTMTPTVTPTPTKTETPWILPTPTCVPGACCCEEPNEWYPAYPPTPTYQQIFDFEDPPCPGTIPPGENPLTYKCEEFRKEYWKESFEYRWELGSPYCGQGAPMESRTHGYRCQFAAGIHEALTRLGLLGITVSVEMEDSITTTLSIQGEDCKLKKAIRWQKKGQIVIVGMRYGYNDLINPGHKTFLEYLEEPRCPEMMLNQYPPSEHSKCCTPEPE